ncbi:phosphate/phosphite/phosphonate ABC transporter substrate-binding protein [Pusillimonas minor]|uniref:Phosphate/phosphite/phosphonate ABC transporter substrate-binding protein n=1 Tax=Pusillimonas minor TaxID=2697024 RepID=A0A842HP94_9BURK|nr:phosphate/phosphite/phosphonate ABC transporter substrate-binding protein [Pusillimonas minor]MBC2769532.1 phosphate/phosphite/phosphonate ABC transporter substrate-binding protein [Pusillimonas minor]
MLRFIVLLIAILASPLARADITCRDTDLRIAVIPKKSMDALVKDYAPLLRHLSKHLDMPVEIIRAGSYDAVTDAIVSGGVDIAWLGPAGYLTAHLRDPGVEPFANLVLEKGAYTPAGNHYQALLVVRADTGAKTLKDLAGQRVALNDPLSTSGSILPNRAFPAAVGLSLSEFFESQVYTGSHDRSLDALLNQRVDAAFVASVRADDYVKQEKMAPDALRVLWRSEPIYYDPFVFSPLVCPALKNRIRHLMLNESSALEGFYKSQQATGLMPASHNDYAPLIPLMGRIAK